MSTEANKAIVIRFLNEAWNKGNPAIADELISPDYVLHGSGQTPGPEGVKRLIAMFRDAFPDARSTFDDVFAEGDRVAVRWATHATHQGEFFGIRPTGREMVYSGIDIFRLQGGKIIERWSSSDTLGLLRQLGAM